MVTPLDLVKCRLQVDPAKYKNLFNGFKVTFKEDGARGLVKGWAPTAYGYSAQVWRLALFSLFRLQSISIHPLGFVQIRLLRSVQSVLHQFDWWRKCFPVPY